MVHHAICVAVTGSSPTVPKREALLPAVMYGVVDPVEELDVCQHCCASSLLCSKRHTDIPPIVAPTVEFVTKLSLPCFVLRQAVPSVVGDQTKIKSVGHRYKKVEF